LSGSSETSATIFMLVKQRRADGGRRADDH
jgi:hypothetical protein